MSANLLDGLTPQLNNGTTEDGGVFHKGATTGHYDLVVWDLPGQAALETNQTYHVGLSVRGAATSVDSLWMAVGYKDASGARNWVKAWLPIHTSWGRVEGTIIVPSGMTPFAAYITAFNTCPETWMANPTLSLGSPVCLASSAHTPYATQDHVSVTYATKSQLKVTDDSIKAEVSARAQTDRNVADLSSRLTQTANSLTSEISDRRSAITTVTGLANAAQSTADAAKSSASSAVSTANSASTSAANAVETANAASSAASSASTAAGKASSDAAAAVKTANSASSTANSAVSTANTAKSTADAAKTSASSAVSTAKTAASDATKAQTMATENQSSIKQLSDSITSEVTERGKLAGRVGTLESTSGTHTSKLEQLAASIKSLVKGESTYTDPNGQSATSGIYSLVTQTRDSVTALFGSYTKTADLASTQAVKDAKKAGTDAQAAASAAQTTADSAKSTAQTAASDAATAKTNAASAVSTASSASTSAANAVKTANAASSTASSASSNASAAVSTANAAKTSAASAVSTANSANSTAGAAKSTADSLATLIRADSTGITVGKSADGKTWSTGRTRMTDSAFQVLDKAGATVAQLAADGVSLLSGLVRIVAGKVSLPGAESVDSITIDAGGGVATVSGLISRLSGLYNGISSTVTAGFATYGGNGITATVRDTKSNIVANAILGVDEATVGIGGQHVKMKGDAFELSHPEYLLTTLMDTSKVPENLDTCGPGVFSYDTSTTSRPTDYGTCVCIRAGDGTTSTWLFEFALPTVGDPLWRRNINGGGWTSWWTITSQ